MLAGAGTKNARLSGAGIFKDDASDAIVRAYLFDGTIRNWQVVIPDFGVMQGPFQVTSLDLSGRHDSEITFDLTLESAGALTFTAI